MFWGIGPVTEDFDLYKSSDRISHQNASFLRDTAALVSGVKKITPSAVFSLAG